MQTTTEIFLQDFHLFLYILAQQHGFPFFTPAAREQTPSSSATAPQKHTVVCCLRVDSSFTTCECHTFSPVLLCLTDLLQQFLLYEFKLHADGHLCNELVASFLGHLFAVSQVDVTYAATALEIGQRLVRDPITDCREKRG